MNHQEFCNQLCTTDFGPGTVARSLFPKTIDQLSERSNGKVLPIAVMRLNGQGEASLSSWVAMLTLQDLVVLLREAGYGEPIA